MIKRTPQEIADFFGCYVLMSVSGDWYITTEKPDKDTLNWKIQRYNRWHEIIDFMIDAPVDHNWTVLYSPDSRTNQQADEGISPERGDAGSYFRNSMHPDNKVESYYADLPDSDNKHQYEVHTHAEYRIVTAHKEIDPESFAKGVMAWVERGWVPAGGISFDKQGRPYQAMVRGV